MERRNALNRSGLCVFRPSRYDSRHHLPVRQYDDDYILNGQEYYDGTASAEEVGVKALDDNTVEYTLKQTTPYFDDVTSMWVYAPVQQATVDANGDTWSTKADTYVCNGPFKVSEINMGESVVLTKNENYWDAANVSL